MDVLCKAKEICEETEVILITSFSTVESAVESATEAMQKGARDFLPKPVNLDLLAEKVENLKEFLLSRRDVYDYRYAMTIIDEDVVRTAEIAERKLSERHLVRRRHPPPLWRPVAARSGRFPSAALPHGARRGRVDLRRGHPDPGPAPGRRHDRLVRGATRRGRAGLVRFRDPIRAEPGLGGLPRWMTTPSSTMGNITG